MTALCSRCGKRPPREGQRYCRQCATEKAREYRASAGKITNAARRVDRLALVHRARGESDRADLLERAAQLLHAAARHAKH